MVFVNDVWSVHFTGRELQQIRLCVAQRRNWKKCSCKWRMSVAMLTSTKSRWMKPKILILILKVYWVLSCLYWLNAINETKFPLSKFHTSFPWAVYETSDAYKTVWSCLFQFDWLAFPKFILPPRHQTAFVDKLVTGLAKVCEVRVNSKRSTGLFETLDDT